MTTATITVIGMHCAGCGLLIDETMEGLSGVTSSSTDLRKETTTVEYDPAQVGPDGLTAEIIKRRLPSTTGVS